MNKFYLYPGNNHGLIRRQLLARENWIEVTGLPKTSDFGRRKYMGQLSIHLETMQFLCHGNSPYLIKR
jgi:hypothetical protein